jgi:ribosome-binding protein aMBF1 (putative translation factor)
MGRPARALTPDRSVRHQFGAELRRWRAERGLTHAGLGDQVWHSAEIVAKVEKGERWPSLAFTERCESVLNCGGELLASWPAVEAQRLASDSRRRRDCEARSRRLGQPAVE